LLAQKTNQKRAASDLFGDYHFLGCPRITTRRLRHLAEPPQTVMLTFRPSLRSLKNANLFPRRSDDIDRLTAIWVDISNIFKTVAIPQNYLRPFEIQLPVALCVSSVDLCVTNQLQDFKTPGFILSSLPFHH
jgi:hypothetical protein